MRAGLWTLCVLLAFQSVSVCRRTLARIEGCLGNPYSDASKARFIKVLTSQLESYPSPAEADVALLAAPGLTDCKRYVRERTLVVFFRPYVRSCECAGWPSHTGCRGSSFCVRSSTF